MSPVTVKVCVAPDAVGAGSPVTCVAVDQLAAVIGDLDQRMSYDVAVPVRLSSPTAAHESAAEVSVVPVTERLAIGAGRTVSGAASVAREMMFEIPDQFGTSSAVLIANQ